MATVLFLAAGSGVPAGGPDPAGGRREIGLGEAVPEEPGQRLQRYLYLNMKDSSICPPLALGSNDPRGGILVLDLDQGLRCVKRIGSDLLLHGPAHVSSGPGVRWQHGSAATDRLYYGYSEPGLSNLRGTTPPAPVPDDPNAVIGCIDLRTDATLWEQPTRDAVCFAVTPDGRRLVAVPDWSQADRRVVTVLDALTAEVLDRVPAPSPLGHGIGLSADGRFLFPSAFGGALTVFDLVAGRAIDLPRAFPALAQVDWGDVPAAYRDFRSLDVATAYQSSGAGDLLFAQVRRRARTPLDPRAANGGLVVIDLEGQRAGLAALPRVLLENAVDPDRSKRHHFSRWSDDSVYWYGHGYCASLSPDERRLWHGNFSGDFRVIVWDATAFPPRVVGILGEGLSSETEEDPLSGGRIGGRNKGGAWISADGSIVFTSDSWCFDTRTWKPTGLMRNEDGRIVRCCRMNEVHFRGKDCVYFGQRYGFGRYREPAKVFPPSPDRTPPSPARDLRALVSPPQARWAGGDVVVSVDLGFGPASDDDGVQRYAVYRDGELVGNCLGRNPGDPVLSPEDAAVFREQVGEVRENAFTVRCLRPGRTYRFEVEPVDFAQNRGPRIGVEVSVPAVDRATEEVLVASWAERIFTRAGAGRDDPRTADRRRACVEALVEWIEQKYRERPWAESALWRCRNLLAGDDAAGDLQARIGLLLAREGSSK